jgi:hypothetical protein
MAALSALLASIRTKPSAATALGYSEMKAVLKKYITLKDRLGAVAMIKASLQGSSKEARMVGDQLIIMLGLGSHATLTSADRESIGLFR